MQIEAAILADSATDYNGRLCILGAFDHIGAPQVPVRHPHMAVVVRVRFQRSEEGTAKFTLIMIDEDGRQYGPKLEGVVPIGFPPDGDTCVANIILAINDLVLPKFGIYTFDFALNGEQRVSMPLYVRQRGKVNKAA